MNRQTFAYNDQDKNLNPNNNNYGGLKPSFRYKESRIIWLNTAFATSSNSSETTYYSFSFDLPVIQLFNRTKLSVASYISNESNAKPIIIKIGDVLVDNDSTYNSDREGFATLFVAHTGVASQLNNNQFSMYLQPQQINKITLYLSNSFSTRNNGFTISGAGAGNFLIGLLMEEEDLITDNTVSQYR